MRVAAMLGIEDHEIEPGDAVELGDGGRVELDETAEDGLSRLQFALHFPVEHRCTPLPLRLAELLFTNAIQHGTNETISQAFICEASETIRRTRRPAIRR